MLLHPDPIAEDRATAEWARWIDRNHGNAFSLLPIKGGHASDQSRLTRSRRTGDSDDLRSARMGIKKLHDLWQIGTPILDLGDQAGQRKAVAGEHLLNKLLRCGVHDLLHIIY